MVVFAIIAAVVVNAVGVGFAIIIVEIKVSLVCKDLKIDKLYSNRVVYVCKWINQPFIPTSIPTVPPD